MVDNKKGELECKIKWVIWKGAVLTFFAILLPILLFLFPDKLTPESESFFEWFSRIGSIMIICAIWMELQLLPISGMMNLPSYAVVINDCPEKTLERYKSFYNFLIIIGFVIAFVGTIIWGYGDFVLRLLATE